MANHKKEQDGVSYAYAILCESIIDTEPLVYERIAVREGPQGRAQVVLQTLSPRLDLTNTALGHPDDIDDIKWLHEYQREVLRGIIVALNWDSIHTSAGWNND